MRNVLSEMSALGLKTFQDDCVVLLGEEYLYTYLLVDTRIVVTRGIDVAAVSMHKGDFVFYLNPEGYLSYSQPERLFILKHEWTHWIDEHPLEAVYYQHKWWNLACDIAINQHLETTHAKRPKDAQMPEMYGLPPFLSPNAYYKLLLEKAEKGDFNVSPTLSSIAIGHQKPTSEDGKPQKVHGFIYKKKKITHKGTDSANEYDIYLIRIGNHLCVFEDTCPVQNKKGKSISFDNLPVCEPYDENGQMKEFKDMKDEPFAEVIVIASEGGYTGVSLRLVEPSEEENNGNGSSQSDGNGDNTTDDTDLLDNLHPDWKSIQDTSPQMMKHKLQETMQNALKHAGSDLSDAIKVKLERFRKSETNWKGELRLFFARQKGQRKSYTYRKRNKRIPFAPGTKKLPRLRIVIILDTSASVTESQLEMFDAEIRKIYRSHPDIHITVITCDTEVRDVFVYSNRLNHSNVSFSGRGGTDFRPPFELIEKRGHKLLKQKPDAVLYLTDGEGIAPERFSIPTLWCLTENGRKPFVGTYGSKEEVSWGRFLRLLE